MSSRTSRERRLAAHRANALLSTGPRTEEGKAKSSLNAVKTGLTGRTVLLPSEDAAAYREHVRRFHEELQPVGVLETHLVQSLADTQWRLNRIPGLEAGILALGRKRCAEDLFAEEQDPAVREALLEAHVYLTEAQPLKNLHLQESRLRRQYANDSKELERLRAARQAEQEEQEEEECDCEDCQRERAEQAEEDVSAPVTSSNGFEFSNLAQRSQPSRNSQETTT